MKTRSTVSASLACLAMLGVAIAAAPAKSSPSADTKLICPTSDDAECYPKLFQPTKDFQVIKPEQDLPPGLHVRMNIWSGEKEARLNIPMEGEDGLLDLPDVHDSAIVVIPQPEEDDFSEPAMRDRVPQKPPVYEAAGKIQPPPPTDSNNDAQSFASAVAALSAGKTAHYQSSLAALTDLSHDIYYGVELVKSHDALETLFRLIHLGPDATEQKQAASIVGHSVQNNPTALKSLLESWEKMDIAQSPGAAMHQICKAASDPTVTKAKIYALNGLVKDKSLRDDWLKAGGMDVLYDILSQTPEADGWAKLAIKLSDFLVDNFLDADMGAEIGAWPKEIASSCEKGETGRGMSGACWVAAIEARLAAKELKDDGAREALGTLKGLLGGVEREPLPSNREL